jgi:hypothetical protein
MGQYKVPQNVEAEDKIIGPLTLKQLIYAAIGFGWAALAFFLLRSLPIVMFLVAFPPSTLFILLAFYNRDGQNFEQLLIAIAGFYSQSRKRIWVKESIIETFKIEPKVITNETNQRNSAEIRSELEKVAQTIDSRGWNKPIVADDQNNTANIIQPSSRLIEPEAPKEETIEQGNDVLDLQSSPLALNIADLINEASAEVRAEAIEQMNDQPKSASTSVTTTPAPAILNLATERDDLTVSQLAATATRMAPLVEGQSVNLRKNGNKS